MKIDKSGNVIDEEFPDGDGDNETPVDPPIADPDNPDTPTNPEEPIEPEPEPTYIYQTINNFYDRVRGALGAGLSITDDMIDLYEYAPYAELQIVKRVPNFCCLSDIKYALFETCIVYMTCYALCPIASQMRIRRQKDPSLELEFAEATNSGNCNRFLELIDDIITCQINEEERRPLFVGFKVTKSTPSIPNALGENSCCCRHWFPPIYKELYYKPIPPSSDDNTTSNNRFCCCCCNCNPTTPEEPLPPDSSSNEDKDDENTANPDIGNNGSIDGDTGYDIGG